MKIGNTTVPNKYYIKMDNTTIPNKYYM